MVLLYLECTYVVMIRISFFKALLCIFIEGYLLLMLILRFIKIS